MTSAFTRPTRPLSRPTSSSVDPSTGHSIGAHVSGPAPIFRKLASPTPHRLSVDIDDMYRALRMRAAERGGTIVALVRLAIGNELARSTDPS